MFPFVLQTPYPMILEPRQQVPLKCSDQPWVDVPCHLRLEHSLMILFTLAFTVHTLQGGKTRQIRYFGLTDLDSNFGPYLMSVLQTPVYSFAK